MGRGKEMGKGRCVPEGQPPHPVLPLQGSRQSRKPSADPTCSVARPPRSVPGAYQLGGALPSHLEFSLPQHW